MKKIGIFLDEIKDKSIDDKQKFSKLGFNTGNMLFWHSLKTQLNLDVKSRWYIDHIDQLDLTEYKAFITTDLIWIRQMQDFSYLNKTLDVIGDLPLIPISIGLQCDSYDYSFKLHPETVKVIKRIEQRCVMGVRGEYTAQILRQHGITNFMVIGCPSMYMNVPGLLTVNNNGQPRRVTMNFETFYSKLDEKRISLLEYGMEHQYSFVEQAQTEISKKQIADKKRLSSISEWLKYYGKCFFDINEWRGYIKEKDFSIGSRFHGNVLALWEGIPALFITCDSRTQELCEHFSLPRIDIKDFDSSKPIEFYYKLADYSDFASVYSKRLEEWKEFIYMNELYTDKEMVLYHAYHAGSLCEVVIHRLTKSKNKKAYLLVGGKGLLGEIYDKLDDFVENQIFDKIIYCNECYGLKAKTEAECETEIEKYFDKVFLDLGISIHDFSEIYSGVDTLHSFGIYLSLKKKHYYFYEMARDFFLNAQNRVNGLPEEMNIYGKVMTKHGASNGTGEYVTRLVYPGSKYRIEENSKVETFDFENKLLELDDDSKNKLLKVYGSPVFPRESKPVSLILTCSQWLLREKKDVKRQAGIMYQLLADYYIPYNEDIVIKPHPLTRFSSNDFIRYFDVPVFPEYFPSNFMTLIKGLKIAKMYTTTSSAVTNLSSNIEFHQLGYVFVRDFYQVIKLHYALSLYYKLKSGFSLMELFHYGLSNDFINPMINMSFRSNSNSKWLDVKNISDNTFAIIDNILWNQGDYQKILIDFINYGYGDYTFVFLNTHNDYFFTKGIKKEYLNKNLYRIELSKHKHKRDVIDTLNSDYVYVYSTNAEVINAVINYSYLKENKYSGIDIKSNSSSSYETIQYLKNIGVYDYNETV